MTTQTRAEWEAEMDQRRAEDEALDNKLRREDDHDCYATGFVCGMCFAAVACLIYALCTVSKTGG